MDVDINLQNQYFSWDHISRNSYNLWWKGTIFFQNNVIRMDDFIDLFLSEHKEHEYNLDSIKKFLHQLNGSYIFVLDTPDFILSSVDRIRSIPLFYSSVDHHLMICDNTQYLVQRIEAPYNKGKGAELFSTSYVTGPDTLFDGVKQLQTGEFLIFDKSDGKHSVHRYFRYLHSNFSDNPEQQLIERLDEVMMNVFNRLIVTTVRQGKTIIVPLSGGLDSRLVVALLKRAGVEDVICFSYGKKGNNEAEISRKVAKALGYRWHFVEYTSERWYECYRSDEMRAYEKYAGNLTSVPHGQDYLAVKVLKMEGKIPDNAVFVPGHTGDMISGGHIPSNIEEIPNNFDQFINYILKRHYVTEPLNGDRDFEQIFRQRIRKSVGDIDIHDSESLADGIEYFDFNERQAKKIVNSVRIYEFFDFEWRIPLWDSELIDFFLRIPLWLRLNQSLYITYIREKVFKGDLESLAQIPCSKMNKQSEFGNIIHQIFKKFPLSETIAKKIFSRYRLILDPMNYHSILPKRDYIKFYLGNLNIESYVHQQYLRSAETGELMNNPQPPPKK